MGSKDSGITWSAASLSIDTLRNPHICSLLVKHRSDGSSFYVSTSAPAAIYCTNDLRESWRKCFSDPLFTDPRMPSNREVPLVTQWGTRLIACLSSGPHGSAQKLYQSDNGGLSWHGINCPFNIWGIGLNSVDTNAMWIGNYGSWPKSEPYNALQYSLNQGRSWIPVRGCKARLFWQLVELPNRALYAATDVGLIRVSLNEY